MKTLEQAIEEAELIVLPKTGMKLKRIEPGTFLMGSPEDEEDRYDDEKQHEVTIKEPFYMGVYPVTQGEWEMVMGNNPSNFKMEVPEGALCVDDGCPNTLPVESVSWEDCQVFLKKLAEFEGLPEGSFRLPTEEEWEYSCRAGATDGPYAKRVSQEELDEVAWFYENSDNKTHPVGLKKPNNWGLYDMLGNVWEWCDDWYEPYK
jgi:formylglycine-generating enzyme required for sulfatase activity